MSKSTQEKLEKIVITFSEGIDNIYFNQKYYFGNGYFDKKVTRNHIYL